MPPEQFSALGNCCDFIVQLDGFCNALCIWHKHGREEKINPFKGDLKSAVLCEWPMQKESWTSCGFMTIEMCLLILSAPRSALEMLLGRTECCSFSSPPAPSDGGEHTVVPYPHL